ncbi:MAG: acetyl-CoA carboxylase, carboxyltransferase subunit beta [bacterium]|nr:acetyl-CoA carboxylase, carboxyltransferase subunit beta [bacterium]MDE0418155.1 acetyl-CoA carboxylase, carboxyltransferase subunit beta [bacterium]
MNWLSNLTLPKIRDLVGRTPSEETLWDKCPSCDQMVFGRDLEESRNVCPRCGYHMRIAPRDRLQDILDDGTWSDVDLPGVATDPLRFRDRKRYSDRLKEAQGKTGHHEAIVVAHGMIGGRPAVVAVFNFDFMGGSMGMGLGEAIVEAARLAVDEHSALIIFSASGGARMQEGILSLMQMARTTTAIAQVKDAGLPYISVLTNPTTGGVTASFAMLGDVSIAEPGAIIGFAGARVIRETIREELPDGFQRSEYLLEHGMLDMVVVRPKMRDTIATLLSHLMPATSRQLPQPAVSDADQLPGGK